MGPSIETTTDAAVYLYGVEPAEFIAARTALVKQLRTDGHKELASAVKDLRKPSLVAAELNRAVRFSTSDLDLLLRTAAELSDGHRAMLAGDSVDLGSLQSSHRAAAASVAAHATRDRDRIASLLEAASLDESCHPPLRAGTFAVEPSPASGFDLLAGAAVAKSSPKVASLDRARRRRQRAHDIEKTRAKPKPEAKRTPEARPSRKRTPKPDPETVSRAENAVALTKRRVDAAGKKRTRAVERVNELERRLADARTNLTETELAEAAAEEALAAAEARLAEARRPESSPEPDPSEH